MCAGITYNRLLAPRELHSATQLLVSSVFQSNIFLSLQMQPRLANTPELESFEKLHLTHGVLISLYAGLPLCHLSLCMNTRRACACLRAESRGCKLIGASGITWRVQPCFFVLGKKKRESMYSNGKRKLHFPPVRQRAPLIRVCVMSGTCSLTTGSAFV